MNYRLRMLLQMAASLAILAFVPNNVARLVAFPAWWLLTFRRLTRGEWLLYAGACALFTVLDYLTLQQELFKFTHPDFLLMPWWEPLIWGYLLVHTIHMVNGPTPRGRRAIALVWFVAFAMPFLALTDQVVLFAVSLALLAAGLVLFHEPYDFAYVGYFLLVGSLWEYVGVWSGQWLYPGDPPGGVAPWFAPMWGGIALGLRRLILPLLRPRTQARSASEGASLAGASGLCAGPLDVAPPKPGEKGER
jgi:hypothetical protein